VRSADPAWGSFNSGQTFFYANVGRFVADMRGLVEGADPPVKWLVFDAGAITSIDYLDSQAVRTE